ncbi:MAG: hypothetical protein HY432_00580 [Candidatus Liptonbacteria bacterium]|nr:hypothetical protein [Candidatus Liptonbacteria bacterium]
MGKNQIFKIQITSSRDGQSALEILIAIGILALSLSTMIIVISGSQSVSVDSQEANQAINLARKSLENAVAAAKNDFAGLISSSSTQDEFLKEVIVEDLDVNTKEVTSRVSWVTDPLRPQKVELTTLVTNWEIFSDTGGDTGGGGPSGDWQNPRTLGSVDLGPGEEATGLDVVNKIIYFSATAASQSKADFFIVNATDGENPYIVSSLNTGAGLNSVDTAGNFAFVANSNTDAQLQVIDISNAASPFVANSFKLTGVAGSGAIGQKVFYLDKKVYIGTKSATGPEFHIIDVSNPNAPSEVGSFEVSGDVNDIFVFGSVAYIATSLNAKELQILNVSNPASIIEIGSFDGAGNDDGKSVFVSAGTTAYLGRAGGTQNLAILDVSDPASPQQLSTANLSTPSNVGVNGIYVRDYLAFLVTDDSNKEFQVWNISSSSNPTVWSSFNFPQVGADVDFEDNLVYVSVRSNDAARIITSQ